MDTGFQNIAAPELAAAAEVRGGAVAERGDWRRIDRVVGAKAPTRGSLGAAPIVAGAVVLVALVAALSRGLLARMTGSGGGLSAHALLGDAAAVVLVLTLLGMILLAYDSWERRRPRAPLSPRARRRLRRPRPAFDRELLLVPLALMAAATLLLGLGVLFGSPSGAARGATGAGQASHAGLAPHAAAARGGNVPINGVLFVALAAVALLALAVLAGRAWARRRPAAEPAHDHDFLVAAVDESLEDLARESDPRRAVIKAYDRMERALAAQGAGRHRAETPLEYMRRALAAVRASQHSVRRLTDLFEQARFSRHWIDEAMKDEAIGALTTLRAELDGGPEAVSAR